jgi:ABC-2 type transport system permease protein
MVRNRKIQKIIWFVLLLVAVNVIAQYVYTRFDFTKEKRFTLTSKTKEILQANTKEITITVFLDGEMPAAFKRLRNATKDLLADYKATSNATIKIKFIDPIAGLALNERDTVIKTLYELGIKPTNIRIKNDAGFAEKLVFPMALVESDGKEMPVKLLQNLGGEAGNYEENINNSIKNLEYIFTSSIKKVITGTNFRIGFTEGNGEPSDLYLYDALNSLGESYVVHRLNLDQVTKEGLDHLNVMVIAKPQKPFTEAQKYKINYFVMKGGRVVWALDQVTADLDSLKRTGSQMVLNKQLNLDDMLFEYGARINYDIIADVNCAEIPVSTGDSGIQMAPWLFDPILMPDTSVNLVKNMDGIRSQFVSTVDTIGSLQVKKQVILRTSPFNKVYNTPKLLSLQMVEEQPDPKAYANKPQTTGVLLEGNFKSVFLNRPVPEGITEKYDLPAQSKPTKMIVIGDGDIFKNQVSTTDGSPFPLGFDRYTQQNYGNKALLLNIADYFTSEDNLMALRNKEVKIRLLDKVKVRTEKSKWQLINVIVPILLLICFAIFQHYYRKHQYAK